MFLQELADIGHRTSSFDNELKETRKDVEDMQKAIFTCIQYSTVDAFGLDLVFSGVVWSLVLQEALREVTEKTARTDEDARNIVKSTRELHQAYFSAH